MAFFHRTSIRRARQLSLLPAPPVFHGGDHAQRKRKTLRPIDPKRPMHIVMRATQARGEWSLLHRRNKARIFITVNRKAEHFGVRVYRFSNVGNHLHILVLPGSRKGFQNFLRAISGEIALLVTGTRKGRALKRRFWDVLAFTRVVSWGREFRSVTAYFAKNMLESLGIPRSEYLLKLLPG
jgi:REP element-mobilizing transposase RayT